MEERHRGVADAPLSKVGLELSAHIHKSTALAMDACRSGAWVPHHALHRCRIVKLTGHTHLHLQHGVDHVHAQVSQSIDPSHALHPTHAIHSRLLADKSESIRVGHGKRVLLLLAVLVVRQLATRLHGAR